MDIKISDLPATTAISGLDIVPVVSSGVLKTFSIDLLTKNLPNVGNKGTSSNAPVRVITSVIAPTASLFLLPISSIPYSIGDGFDGQEITLVSLSSSIVLVNGISVIMPNESVLTVIYLTKWLIKSSFGCSTH